MKARSVKQRTCGMALPFCESVSIVFRRPTSCVRYSPEGSGCSGEGVQGEVFRGRVVGSSFQVQDLGV